MSQRFILEDNINNWSCCFNCVFASKLRKSVYRCRLKWYIQNFIEKNRVSIKYAPKVDKADTCQNIITRPKFAAETYGFSVILYNTQQKGVKKFNSREKTEYISRIEELIKKLGLKFPPSYKIEFSWSFANSRDYALVRNLVVYQHYNYEIDNIYININSGTYTCEKCGDLFYHDEVEVHHILEQTKRGSDTLANLTILCKFCHGLESWKLATGKSKIPAVVIWKKLSSSRAELWNNRARDLEHKIKGLHRSIEDFEKYIKSDTLDEDFKISFHDRIHENEQKIAEYSITLKRSMRKFKFWDKYHKQTENWSYKVKHKPKIDPNKFHKIDEFLA